MPDASMTLLKGLLAPELKTYSDILGDFDVDQSVIVTGEEDNVFVPNL